MQVTFKGTFEGTFAGTSEGTSEGQRPRVQRFQRRSEVTFKGTFRGTFEGTSACFQIQSFWVYVPTSVHTSITVSESMRNLSLVFAPFSSYVVVCVLEAFDAYDVIFAVCALDAFET